MTTQPTPTATDLARVMSADPAHPIPPSDECQALMRVIKTAQRRWSRDDYGTETQEEAVAEAILAAGYRLTAARGLTIAGPGQVVSRNVVEMGIPEAKMIRTILQRIKRGKDAEGAAYCANALSVYINAALSGTDQPADRATEGEDARETDVWVSDLDADWDDLDEPEDEEAVRCAGCGTPMEDGYCELCGAVWIDGEMM